MEPQSPSNFPTTEPAAKPAVTPPTVSAPPHQSATAAPAPSVNFLGLLITFLKKPVSTMEAELPKFFAFRNSAILACITSAIFTLCSFLSTVIGLVVEKGYDYTHGEKQITYDLDWSNLERLDVFAILGKTFLIALVFMAAIALVYFAASRIFKQKTSNYSRILAVVALAALPIALGALLSTIVSLFIPLIGSLIALTGALYAGYSLYEGASITTELTGNKRVYGFVLAVLMLMAIAYIALRLYLGDSISIFKEFDLTSILYKLR